MRIMFTGVHGSGKSTTAMALSKLDPEYLYIPSFAGPVAKKMGFDLNQPHSPSDLLAYQEKVLAVFIEAYKATEFLHTIYDRSPIDIAAYIYAGLKGKLEEDKFLPLINRCLNAVKAYCDVLIYPTVEFSEPMENKYNRPVSEDGYYARHQFDKLIDYYVHKVHKDCKIIDVPVQYQYNDRINFIRNALKNV